LVSMIDGIMGCCCAAFNMLQSLNFNRSMISAASQSPDK